PPRHLGIPRGGHEPDHADPNGGRRTGRDPAPQDHAGRRPPQGHAARGPPVLAAGAIAHAGAGGAAHVPAPPRRGSARGVPHRAALPPGSRSSREGGESSSVELTSQFSFRFKASITASAAV